MQKYSTQTTHSRSQSGDDRQPFEKKILALDALSKLTQRFSKNPDFQELIDVLLMTLSGQLSVADSFAILQNPDSYGAKHFSATGKFKNTLLLASLDITEGYRKYFLENPSVLTVDLLERSGDSAKLAFTLAACNLALVCPLVHNDKCFGIIGLGNRVSKKDYGQEDKELLMTVVNTITPFVANSYLFSEVTRLNSWYLDILNSVKPGVFVFDEKNRLKKINSAGLNIIKALTPNVLDSRSLHLAPIELVFPYTVFRDWSKRFIQEGRKHKSRFLGNMVMETEGTQRIYSVNISRNTENPGIEKDLIITLDDVTAQKENEQRLFDLQKLADKGLMVSSISHELNNLLFGIIGCTEIMEVALDKADCQKATTALDQIRTIITSMERFTAGITDQAKLNAKKETANLNSIVTDVLPFISLQERFKRLEILSELDSSVPDFPLDSDQITQLLLNLLNNAADAVNQLDREKGRITVTTLHHKNDAILSVSDNGAGIKPEVKERLFTSRLTTKEKGHGYGLMMCKKIIEDHGGSITIDSQVGKATVFSIRLPIAIQA